MFAAGVTAMLDDIQRSLFEKARGFRDANIRRIDAWNEFCAWFTPANKEKPEAHGGFALSHWCGGAACETRANDDLAVTIRCIPLEQEPGEGHGCVVCGQPSRGRVLFAKDSRQKLTTCRRSGTICPVLRGKLRGHGSL